MDRLSTPGSAVKIRIMVLADTAHSLASSLAR